MTSHIIDKRKPAIQNKDLTSSSNRLHFCSSLSPSVLSKHHSLGFNLIMQYFIFVLLFIPHSSISYLFFFFLFLSSLLNIFPLPHFIQPSILLFLISLLFPFSILSLKHLSFSTFHSTIHPPLSISPIHSFLAILFSFFPFTIFKEPKA